MRTTIRSHSIFLYSGCLNDTAQTLIEPYKSSWFYIIYIFLIIAIYVIHLTGEKLSNYYVLTKMCYSLYGTYTETMEVQYAVIIKRRY